MVWNYLSNPKHFCCYQLYQDSREWNHCGQVMPFGETYLGQRRLLPANWLINNEARLHMLRAISQNMMPSSNGNIFRVTGPLRGEFTGPGEFPTQRPVTRSFDVFFDLRLNKRLSKQPWGWWFETPPWSLWRQCNEPFQVVENYTSLNTAT